MQLYVINIKWSRDGDFTSPPIGPIEGYTNVQRQMRAFRKLMRKRGAYFQGCVTCSYLAPPSRAEGWLSRGVDR